MLSLMLMSLLLMLLRTSENYDWCFAVIPLVPLGCMAGKGGRLCIDRTPALMHCTGVPVHVMGGEEGGRGGVENAAAVLYRE